MICLFLCLEPPVITKKPLSKVVVVPGSTLSLCCEATGSPPPNVQWSRADQSFISTLASQDNGCLKINTARDNSDADYICRAANRYGLAETTTTVIFTGKLLKCICRLNQQCQDLQYLDLPSQGAHTSGVTVC